MTSIPLKPRRGGFPRSFSCGLFIRDYLLGHGPNGSPKIDPAVGAPQADIFYHYKTALIMATAFDRATMAEEKKARKEKRPIDPENIDKLADLYRLRMPYKGHGCRYHSFVTYFSTIKKLGWVEATGREEASAFQDHYPKGPPRRYFRLTRAGRNAGAAAWSNPHLTLYGK